MLNCLRALSASMSLRHVYTERPDLSCALSFRRYRAHLSGAPRSVLVQSQIWLQHRLRVYVPASHEAHMTYHIFLFEQTPIDSKVCLLGEHSKI